MQQICCQHVHAPSVLHTRPCDDRFAGHCHAQIAMLSTQSLHFAALQVFLNGNRVPVKTFQDYVNLYLSPGTQRIHEKLGDRWEVCISLAEQGQFQQASSWAFCCWYCISLKQSLADDRSNAALIACAVPCRSALSILYAQSRAAPMWTSLPIRYASAYLILCSVICCGLVCDMAYLTPCRVQMDVCNAIKATFFLFCLNG